ncbi:amidohydrolase family protein [Streptomyces sp. TRM43335]|uniref:Amidohydrolase family protein n=1 Tax=Streptomyces taklimakanensis TaxID=2569853 RepID=A0A6G2BC58_9ACTN|nr:amidohydrolase [Streptomyces taklimakanensis]MTE19857.1 amidohydrolase family protein [Streptomyces taklimakanensis]
MLDLKLTGARVRTVDDAHPRAHTLGVLHGRIVGLDDTVADLPARTTVDCHGATVVPGFGDAHNHMAWFGQSLAELDLSDADTPDAVHDAVARRAATLPADAWIVGSGYDDTVLGGHPHRTALDRAGGGRPVWLKHRSGHMCAVSSEVLRLAGVLAGTAAEPEGGVVVRDASGAPTGLLQERAQSLVTGLVQPYPVEELADAIGRASAVYASEGLTHVTEAGIGRGLIGRSPVEAAAYQLARERGTLATRVELMVAADNLHPLHAHPDDDITAGIDLGLRTGFGDDRLRLGPMKIWLDGSLIGRTAAVTEPLCGHDHTAGVYQDDPEAMRALVVAAHRAGWRIAAHAIGDAAVDLALDALDEAHRAAPRPGARHRIEHSGVVRPDQLRRYVDLGVTPVPQARFLHAVGDTMAEALGPDRTGWLYRHRSFLDHGLRVPGSSDRPVAPGAPLLGMQSMVERLSRDGAVLGPDERVTAEVALRAYTLDAAWVSLDEDRRGSLTPGKLADLVLLSDDPVETDGGRIGAIDVLATFVSGACAHGAEALEKTATVTGPLPTTATPRRPHPRSHP